MALAFGSFRISASSQSRFLRSRNNDQRTEREDMDHACVTWLCEVWHLPVRKWMPPADYLSTGVPSTYDMFIAYRVAEA